MLTPSILQHICLVTSSRPEKRTLHTDMAASVGVKQSPEQQFGCQRRQRDAVKCLALGPHHSFSAVMSTDAWGREPVG